MTKQEKIIVSAFTEILMCDFSDVQEYIEEKLGRPLWTHELADKRAWDEIREKTAEDFLEICKQEEPERKRGKWIVEKDATGYRYGRCSECGMTQYAGKLNYCPNCGAKMEVEE